MKTKEQAAEEYAKSQIGEWTTEREDAIILPEARLGFLAGIEYATKWITVADEEPKEFEKVLLSAGSLPNIFVGYFNGEDFVDNQTKEEIDYFRVLHWRPIEM